MTKDQQVFFDKEGVTPEQWQERLRLLQEFYSQNARSAEEQEVANSYYNDDNLVEFPVDPNKTPFRNKQGRICGEIALGTVESRGDSLKPKRGSSCPPWYRMGSGVPLGNAIRNIKHNNLTIRNTGDIHDEI